MIDQRHYRQRFEVLSFVAKLFNTDVGEIGNLIVVEHTGSDVQLLARVEEDRLPAVVHHRRGATRSHTASLARRLLLFIPSRVFKAHVCLVFLIVELQIEAERLDVALRIRIAGK